MKSYTTPEFWTAFNSLPTTIQELARKKFGLWKIDPHHPSLHFKLIKSDLWSVRVNNQYRALAVHDDGAFAWVWIGTHAEYDRLIR